MARKSKFLQLTQKSYEFLKTKINQTRLDNGILVITERITFFNSFALGIGINVGSRDDYPGKEGISHLLEHCVFRRTKNYESKQINELFEKYGAYANAFTTKEYTTFYVRALNRNFFKVWDLLREIVFEPKFDLKDINKEKSIVKEEVRSYNEDPEEEIFDITDKYLFQNSSLSHPIVGGVNTLNNIELNDIVRFYNEFYIPSNIVLVYIGELSHEEIVDLFSKTIVKKEYNHIYRNRRKLSDFNIKFQKKLKRQFIQSHMSFSRILPILSAKERYLAAITNLLLGDCSSSRLYKSIREKSALVYNVFSLFTTYSDCSSLYIYSSTHPKKQEKTFEMISKELEKLHNLGFTENELFLAKEQIKSSTIMALENYSERLQSIIKSELTFGDYEPLTKTIQLVDSITLDELNDFVYKNFAPTNWSSIIFEPK